MGQVEKLPTLNVITMQMVFPAHWEMCQASVFQLIVPVTKRVHLRRVA